MRKIIFYVFFVCIFFVVSLGFAIDDRSDIMSLSIDGAIRLALMNNFDIQIAKLDRKITTENISIADSIYDTNLGMALNYKVDEDELTTSLAENKSNTTNFNLNLLKKFFLGMILGIDFNNKRNSAQSNIREHNPYYDSSLKLSITQPILKNGFGVLDRNNIKIVKLNVESVDKSLLNKIENSIANVENYYWKLWFNYQFVKIKEESLSFANKFLEITKEQFNNGALEETDLFASEANVKSRESELLRAKVDLDNAISDFKIALNYFPKEKILPTDEIEVNFKCCNIEDSLKKAFEYNRTLADLRLQAESNKLTLKVKHNSVLPKLDLVASFTANGLARDYMDAIGEAMTPEDPTYYVGVNMSMSLENRKIKAELRQAELNKIKILTNIDKTERQLKVNIQKAVREIEALKKEIEYSKEVIELEEKKLAGEEKKYKFGRSSSDIILRYENDLLLAKINYFSNLTAYKNAIINLKLIQNIILDEIDWVTYESR